MSDKYEAIKKVLNSSSTMSRRSNEVAHWTASAFLTTVILWIKDNE